MFKIVFLNVAVFENWVVSHKIQMLGWGAWPVSSLDEGKMGEGARHRAEAVDIATLVLAGLIC